MRYCDLMELDVIEADKCRAKIVGSNHRTRTHAHLQRQQGCECNRLITSTIMGCRGEASDELLKALFGNLTNTACNKRRFERALGSRLNPKRHITQKRFVGCYYLDLASGSTGGHGGRNLRLRYDRKCCRLAVKREVVISDFDTIVNVAGLP
jgi:hypothetical protein